MSPSDAQKKALEVGAAFQFVPTSLINYRSTGKIIAIGDAGALQRCNELPAGLDITPLSNHGERIEVRGYLGQFKVSVTDPQGDLIHQRGDAVLDLHDQAILSSEILPPGYFHMPSQRWRQAELIAALEDLVGEFEKPKYFDYDPSICAHGVNGKIACRQCIDACPADAIQSLGERIEVNANLCQGGGSCTAVCPSGAIRYLYPTLGDQGKRLRDSLRAFLAHGGQQPIVLFHAVSCVADDYRQSNPQLLPIAVEELGSVGMDLCLSALAYGASQVILLADEEVPPSTRANLQLQLDWVQTILVQLGFAAATVTLAQSGQDLPGVDSRDPLEPAVYDMPMAKRNAMLQALDHLAAQLKPSSERVSLPASAPFGEVIVDAEKCTLCMACVGACPGRALQDGSNRELPELFFIESNCLQCGACVQTCPEAAMQLAPRLVFDAEIRHRARALNRDTPFACIACGKPFAPSSAINKMQDKLKDHHMFGTQRALDRLKMCEDCRVVDIVQDPDAMGGGQFDPLKRFQ